MAKTKPIGVRFDENLLNKFKEMGISSPQRTLNFLEQWYLNNLEKVIAFNNANKQEIEEKRNYLNDLIDSDKWTKMPKPEKMKGESGIDYSIRLAQWKENNK